MRVPIACTLTATEVPGRLDAWKGVLDHVEQRLPLDGGIRLVLGPTAPIGDIADLAAAEQGCCSFFAFALTIDDRGRALEVTAPAEAAELLAGLFG